MDYEEPADVAIFDGFKDMPEEELKALYDSLGLAMTFEDFRYIQNYYYGEEDRNPSMTEIRVLDTYWSDHCRHTTFSTELRMLYLVMDIINLSLKRHIMNILLTVQKYMETERISLSA